VLRRLTTIQYLRPHQALADALVQVCAIEGITQPSFDSFAELAELPIGRLTRAQVCHVARCIAFERQARLQFQRPGV